MADMATKTFYTENSTYELDERNSCIRRTSSTHAPTQRQGVDGEWRTFVALDWVVDPWSSRLFIDWDGEGHGTLTSRIVEMEEDEEQDPGKTPGTPEIQNGHEPTQGEVLVERIERLRAARTLAADAAAGVDRAHEKVTAAETWHALCREEERDAHAELMHLIDELEK